MDAATAKPPPLALSLLEPGRAVGELMTLPAARVLLGMAPEGDGHAVVTMPGFLAGDRTTGPLRRSLSRQGYDARPWKLGRNLGPQMLGEDNIRLTERVLAVHRETGRKVSLIGWSLGGVMAREIAKQMPDVVRQVITLGSPFAGHPKASAVSRIYRAVTGQDTRSDDFHEMMAHIAEPPAHVPSTAIFTRTDGIVHWRGCLERPSPLTDNIEVYASHCGIGVNPLTMYLLADRLGQAEGAWRPFDRDAHPWLKLAFPSSGHSYGLSQA